MGCYPCLLNNTAHNLTQGEKSDGCGCRTLVASGGGQALPRPPADCRLFGVKISFYPRNLTRRCLIRRRQSAGSTPDCFPPSGCGKPSPTAPAVRTTPNIAALFWNCPHPAALRALDGGGSRSPVPLTRPVSLTLPQPAAGKTSPATGPPCAGGSRPRRRSRWSLAWPDGGWLPPGSSPDPSAQAGAK